MKILSTVGLNKHFAGVHVLDKVDISVENKTIHGLVGPNGSTKTTFFNVVTGLLPPTEGNIYLDSTDTTHLIPHTIARKGIRSTFQLARVMTGMSCLENVTAEMYSTGIFIKKGCGGEQDLCQYHSQGPRNGYGQADGEIHIADHVRTYGGGKTEIAQLFEKHYGKGAEGAGH